MEGHVFLPGLWIAAGRVNRGTKLQASGHMAIFAGFSRQALAVCHNRQSGFAEDWRHLGQKQCKSKAEAKLVLAMLRRSLRSLRSSNSTLLRSRSQRLASRPF